MVGDTLGGERFGPVESLKPIEVVVSIYDKDIRIARTMNHAISNKGPFPEANLTITEYFSANVLPGVNRVPVYTRRIEREEWERHRKDNIAVFHSSRGPLYLSSSPAEENHLDGIFHVSGTEESVFPHGLGHILMFGGIDRIDKKAYTELQKILLFHTQEKIIKPYKLDDSLLK